MNKHDLIKNLIFKYFHKSSMLEDETKDEQEILVYQYINEAEATEKNRDVWRDAYYSEAKELEELQRDVNRYWELTYREKWSNDLTVYETNERKELFRKLSKVGVE